MRFQVRHLTSLHCSMPTLQSNDIYLISICLSIIIRALRAFKRSDSVLQIMFIYPHSFSLWTHRLKSCEFKTRFEILLIPINPFKIEIYITHFGTLSWNWLCGYEYYFYQSLSCQLPLPALYSKINMPYKLHKYFTVIYSIALT